MSGHHQPCRPQSHRHPWTPPVPSRLTTSNPTDNPVRNPPRRSTSQSLPDPIDGPAQHRPVQPQPPSTDLVNSAPVQSPRPSWTRPDSTPLIDPLPLSPHRPASSCHVSSFRHPWPRLAEPCHHRRAKPHRHSSVRLHTRLVNPCRLAVSGLNWPLLVRSTSLPTPLQPVPTSTTRPQSCPAVSTHDNAHRQPLSALMAVKSGK